MMTSAQAAAEMLAESALEATFVRLLDAEDSASNFNHHRYLVEARDAHGVPVAVRLWREDPVESPFDLGAVGYAIESSGRASLAEYEDG